MGYQLAVDVGTTFTAAAISAGGQTEMASLSDHGSVIPSLVFVGEDDTILVGDAAARRAVTSPLRVAREFKRRLGDPTALVLGGMPWSPTTLTARLLGWVVETV